MNRRTEDEDAGLTEQEHFLGRWSRRKQATQKGELVARSETTREMSGDGDTTGDEENSQDAPPPLTDADMPSLNDLDGDSDYSGFLSPDVSEELRRMALRQLFHSAQFNICDGLDDYDEDFTSFEKLGDIVTSDMKHRMEMEKKKLEERQREEESALLETKPEDDTDSSTDESDSEQEGTANDSVDNETDVDEEAPKLSDNDSEIEIQPDSTPDLIERSPS
jgi:hypothetical protein